MTFAPLSLPLRSRPSNKGKPGCPKTEHPTPLSSQIFHPRHIRHRLHSPIPIPLPTPPQRLKRHRQLQNPWQGLPSRRLTNRILHQRGILADGRRRRGIDETAELRETTGVVGQGADGLEDPDVGGEGRGEGLDVSVGGDGVGGAGEEGGPAGFAEDVVNEGEVVALGDEGGGVEAVEMEGRR